MSGARIAVGDRASLTRSFGREEVAAFARLSGDDNPIHLDEAHARNTPFGACIVHGSLLASVFSALLGRELPGAGTIYLGQTLRFFKPVLLDEPVEFSVEVVAIREDKPIVTLRTLCIDAHGKLAVEGEATVKLGAPAGA